MKVLRSKKSIPAEFITTHLKTNGDVKLIYVPGIYKGKEDHDMIMKFPGKKLKAVTLSYDDGVRDDIRLVETMAKYGLRGTFNLNSGIFSKKSGERRLTADEAADLYEKNGMEIAAHGLFHRFPTQLDSNLCTYEMLKDRENLEALTGGIIRGFAYAYGNYNDDVVRVLGDCGYAYARTTVSTEKFDIPMDWLRMPATCHHRNPRLPELVNEFLKSDVDIPDWRKKPSLFYLWGHSYEFSDNNNWEIIERFGDTVGGRDDVWYATNIEIYDYVTAYRRLHYSCDAKTVMNPTSATIHLYENGEDYTVHPGETIKIK